MSGPARPADPASVAFLVLAHNDPEQVVRLRSALEPCPVFVHVDRRVTDAEFAALTDGLPPARIIQPRSACAWADFGLVQAELDGYRQVLARSTAQHIVVASGADYPLWPVTDIVDHLAAVGDRSVARVWTLPFPAWGRSGGFARLRYRHWVWRKHMIRLPLPRRIPAGVVPSGASVWKIISRRHAQAVLDAVDAHPELVAFWRRSWCADETFIPTLLRSPELTGIDWDAESVTGEAWWIGWDGTKRKSPPWLDESHFPVLAQAADPTGDRDVPAMFARKVSSTTSAALLDRIDAELRTGRSALADPEPSGVTA